MTIPSSARRAGRFCDLLWLFWLLLIIFMCVSTEKAPKNRNSKITRMDD